MALVSKCGVGIISPFWEREPEVPQGAGKTSRWELGFAALVLPHYAIRWQHPLSPTPRGRYMRMETTNHHVRALRSPLPFFALVKIPLQALHSETQKFSARPSSFGKNTTNLKLRL